MATIKCIKATNSKADNIVAQSKDIEDLFSLYQLSSDSLMKHHDLYAEHFQEQRKFGNKRQAW